MTALMNLLTEDVTFWADGGGKFEGVATRQLSGRSTVIRFMLDNSPIFRNTLPADSRAELAEINGQLALITRSGDRAFAAYEVLCSRGAEFLTPPVDWGYEVRAFLRDPDGHLTELTQSGHQ
jgi:hypothetical protein